MEGQVYLEGPDSQEVTEGQGGSKVLDSHKVIIDILKVPKVWGDCTMYCCYSKACIVNSMGIFFTFDFDGKIH